jgi:hypothetical protein
VVGFVKALEMAERGFEAWASKSHNKKWFRLIDGTPIKNDLCVNIAEAIVRSDNSEFSEEGRFGKR